MSEPICGIYSITNSKNGRVYIGSSIDILTRFKGHRSELKRGRHHNKKLQADVYRYGLANFTFEILETLSRIESLLDERERYWIQDKQSTDPEKGYNTSKRRIYNDRPEFVYVSTDEAREVYGISVETLRKLGIGGSGRIPKVIIDDILKHRKKRLAIPAA